MVASTAGDTIMAGVCTLDTPFYLLVIQPHPDRKSEEVGVLCVLDMDTGSKEGVRRHPQADSGGERVSDLSEEGRSYPRDGGGRLPRQRASLH